MGVLVVVILDPALLDLIDDSPSTSGPGRKRSGVLRVKVIVVPPRDSPASLAGGSIGNVNVREGITWPPFREGPGLGS